MCALIAAQEVIEACDGSVSDYIYEDSITDFWVDVKQEIENL